MKTIRFFLASIFVMFAFFASVSAQAQITAGGNQMFAQEYVYDVATAALTGGKMRIVLMGYVPKGQ
jgi:hypothetical protein